MQNRRRSLWTLAVLLLLIGSALGGWKLLSRRAENQNVAEVRQLQAELFSPDNKQSFEERGKAFERMRQKVDQLSESQRKELFASGRDQFRDRMRKDVEAYFKLPPDERKKEMDKKLDQMEAMRKQFAGMRFPGSPGGPRPGGNSGGDSGNGANNQNGSGSAASNGPPPGAPPFRRPQLRDILSHTTPQDRAYMLAFMDEMQRRARERGIQMPGPPR